jgi:tRNA A-37 threonylcarbamoyl transferase component Bud32
VFAAALAVSLAGVTYAVVPAGKLRSIAMWVSAALLATLGLARVYLGVDHPFDVLLAAAAGWGAAAFAFRFFCPEAIFPVVCRGGKAAAHLEIDDDRRRAIAEAMEEQAGLELISVEPFGEEGSGGSTPLKIEAKRNGGGRVETLFGKLYSDSHLRADRWYKLARTIRYGALEDEQAFSSVRHLVEHEDYMLRLMREGGVPTVEPRGVIELDPEREYLILMTFLARAEEADEDAAVDDDVIDAGLHVVRSLWDRCLAHRDIKPGNVLIRDGRVHLIDVAFGQLRPSAWRQAVDLAYMMLVLALGSSAERVYHRAAQLFTPEEIGEAFAAARGPAIPRQLRQAVKEQDVDLVERFRGLAPDHEPIALQRWSVWRIAITVKTAVVVGALLALVLVNLGDWRAP